MGNREAKYTLEKMIEFDEGYFKVESTVLEAIETGEKLNQCKYFKAKVVTDKETTKKTLKWVHIFISNAKRNFLGNYHKIKKNIFNHT